MTYWYKFTVHYCPVCGREDKFKERQYTEKPERIEDRYVFEQHYDWCNEGYA